MDIDITKIVEACLKSTETRIRTLNTLNIIVAGKTGVGKSTLVNAIFKDNLAATGIGHPVTQHTRKYTKSNIPLQIYDTKGLELGKEVQENVKEEILGLIEKGNASNDINQSIHCIWYCISTTSNRIEDEEINWLKEFTRKNSLTRVPVIVILTQSFSKPAAQKMKNVILDANLNVAQVIPVLAQDYELGDPMPTIPAYGLDTLVNVMCNILPEKLIETFQYLQKAALDAKIQYAHNAVVAATAAALAAGAVPIPFSDAAALVPIQAAMIGKITVTFGLDISQNVLIAFISTVLGTAGTTIAGKTMVSNLLKLVPGVGSGIGSAISAATAGALTTALGEAYIQLMVAVYKGELSSTEIGTKTGQDKMNALFKQQLNISK